MCNQYTAPTPSSIAARFGVKGLLPENRFGKVDQMVFNPKVVDLLPLHVCFKHDAATLKIRDAFDLALSASDPAKLEVDYFKNFTVRR